MNSRNLLMMLAAVVGVGGIVMLNVAQNRSVSGNTRVEHDEDAPPAKSEAPQTEKPAPGGPAADSLANLPADSTVGPADAKHTVVVGWSWTPEVQADPSKVYNTVQALRKAAPDLKVRVVNTDAVPDAESGVVVDGKKVADTAPDGSLPQESVMQAVKDNTHGASPAAK